MRTPSEDFIDLRRVTDVAMYLNWRCNVPGCEGGDSRRFHAWSDNFIRLRPAVTAECRKCHRLPKVIAYIV